MIPPGPRNEAALPQQDARAVPWRVRDVVAGGVIGVVAGFVAAGITGSLMGVRAASLSTFDIVAFSTIAYGVIGGSLWFFALGRHGVSWRALFPGSLSAADVLRLALTALGALILSGLLTVAVLEVTGAPDPPRDQLLGSGEEMNPLNWVLLLWVACVVAPTVEELAFRGLLFRSLRARWSWSAAALPPAVLFACAHPIPIQWPAFVALGLILAAVAERTNTLLGPIVVHAGYNGLVLLNLYVLSA